MKEFYTINVGDSPSENFLRSENAGKRKITKMPFSDESFLNKSIDISNFLKNIFNFVNALPSERSGEFNSFLRVKDKKEPKEISVYLFGVNTASNEIYMQKEFNDLVILPSLFYFPKGREMELLENLKDKKLKSGGNYERLKKEFSNEIERLENYGIIKRDQDESGKQITNNK
ncbi:MAG: hypothetical protein ACUVQP_12540 [Bacteroidales bacterium]